MNAVHRRKVQYYEEITEDIKGTHDVQIIITTSATLSWKGIWSEDSVKDLKNIEFNIHVHGNCRTEVWIG